MRTLAAIFVFAAIGLAFAGALTLGVAAIVGAFALDLLAEIFDTP